MFSQVFLGVGLLLVTFPSFGRCGLVPVSTFTFTALQREITVKLGDLVTADFARTNSSLAVESSRFAINCQPELAERDTACASCIENSCKAAFKSRCGQDLKAKLKKVICAVSPHSCRALAIGLKAAKELKRAVGKVKDAVKKGFQKVGGIVKKIFNPVRKIVRIIKNPIRSVVRSLGRFIRLRLPRIRIPRIRIPRIRIRFSRGWKKKRQVTEPSCDDIKNDSEGSCLYYQETCDICSYLPPVCGTNLGETIATLERLENRLHQLIELYEIDDSAVFNLKSVRFDPASYQSGGYPGVQVSFLALGQAYTVIITDAIPVMSPPEASPLIANQIFDKLLQNV